MKIEIKGYIHARSSTDSYGTPIVRHTFWPWEDCVDDSKLVAEHTIVCDVPEEDPVLFAVEMLRAEKLKIIDEAAAKAGVIDMRLQKLLALTNEAAK